jgi:lipopolysaccharide transport system ATP-binding protein
VKQGEVLGIIGRNGAGKSTLLKILSRTTAPTTGIVKIKGRVASLLEVGTGFHPELSGRDNIFLNGAILGMSRREIERKFDEIVDFAGVERYIDTPVKRYSSGMYVRLAFGVAAHLESEILIVDEVLAVGDAEFQKKCLGKMGEVSKGEGRTVLFVSHNMTSIKQLCNKGILLENGKLTENSKIELVINKYIYEGTNLKQENFEFLFKLGIKQIFLTSKNGKIITDVSSYDDVFLNFEFFDETKKILGLTIFDEGDNPIISAVSSDANIKGYEFFKLLLPVQYFTKGNFRLEINLNGSNLENAFNFTKIIPNSNFVSKGFIPKATLVTTQWL